MSYFDHASAKHHVEMLYKAARLLDGWREEQTETFIRVGEYGLALDGIAYAYLENHADMDEKHAATFERLADAMRLQDDDELQGVARLRETIVDRRRRETPFKTGTEKG